MTVFDNAEQHRFEMPIEGSLIAAAYYRIDGEGRIDLIHTEVPSEFAGQGLATKLATGVFELARETDRQLVLSCSFMADFYRRHPEYSDIVGG